MELKTQNSKLKTSLGFTLLFASLVGALVLTVGMAILSIALKQLTLTSAGKATQQSFYSADTGVECALYLDRGAGLGDCRLGFFPTPDGLGGYFSCLNPDPAGPPVTPVSADAVRCMGEKIPLTDVTSEGLYRATTRFTFDNGLTDSDDVDINGAAATHGDICFVIAVTKQIDDPGTPPDETATIIESRGYNTCSTNTTNRYERAIRSVNQ